MRLLYTEGTWIKLDNPHPSEPKPLTMFVSKQYIALKIPGWNQFAKDRKSVQYIRSVIEVYRKVRQDADGSWQVRLLFWMPTTFDKDEA